VAVLYKILLYFALVDLLFLCKEIHRKCLLQKCVSGILLILQYAVYGTGTPDTLAGGSRNSAISKVPCNCCNRLKLCLPLADFIIGFGCV
jgi:hypothetical protein